MTIFKIIKLVSDERIEKIALYYRHIPEKKSQYDPYKNARIDFWNLNFSNFPKSIFKTTSSFNQYHTSIHLKYRSYFPGQFLLEYDVSEKLFQDFFYRSFQDFFLEWKDSVWLSCNHFSFRVKSICIGGYFWNIFL